MVRHVWPDEPIESYNDALCLRAAASHPDPGHCSVLVAHQFAGCRESEWFCVVVDSVGTLPVRCL